MKKTNNYLGHLYTSVETITSFKNSNLSVY